MHSRKNSLTVNFADMETKKLELYSTFGLWTAIWCCDIQFKQFQKLFAIVPISIIDVYESAKTHEFKIDNCSSLWQESQFNGLEVFECCLSIAILNLINNHVAKIFTHQEFTWSKHSWREILKSQNALISFGWKGSKYKNKPGAGAEISLQTTVCFL